MRYPRVISAEAACTCPKYVQPYKLYEKGTAPLSSLLDLSVRSTMSNHYLNGEEVKA